MDSQDALPPTDVVKAEATTSLARSPYVAIRRNIV